MSGTDEALPKPDLIFVDLDGSLVSTDLLWEHVFVLIRKRPWVVFLLALWALRGRAALKAQVARRTEMEPALLPYRSEVIDLLRHRRANGARLVLATASPRPWAEAVAGHLQLFDAVLATEPGRNLKGAAKLEAVREYCRTSGHDHFEYVGDSSADLAIWRECARAYVVAPPSGLIRRLAALSCSVPIEAIGESRGRFHSALRALRPQQWAKNALVFVPLLTGLRLTDFGVLSAAMLAAIAFSLCASAIYVVNDLVDLGVDRAHVEKRRRPFASGQLPLAWGPPLCAIALTAAFALAALALPPAFVLTLATYLALTTAYSFVVKSRVMADVLVLAGLYSIRIFAGGAAAGIAISEWLIGFSMFFFLSLAFAKRYVELDRAQIASGVDPRIPVRGRGYRPSDIGLIETLGPTSGYIAILVLALYIQSEEVQRLYRSPAWLWPLCLAMIYWISRIWFLAKRGELPGDPVVFALTDRRSLLLGLVCLLCMAAGTLLSTIPPA